MAQTNYYLGKTTNSAGESEINLRLYVSRDIRLRIGSGIWLDRKRWGKKNDINIPIIQGEERELLLEKRNKLKALTDVLEQEINTSTDKTAITREYLEKIVKRFHKPMKAKREFEKSFFDVIDTYLAAHKLSENRLKNFRVLARCLHRFELYKRKDGSRGFTLSFANLTPELLRQIEDFLLDEKSVFLQYPEIYEQYPYSAKVAVKTPKRKRPPTLDEKGNEVPKGMPKSRGQNTVADMLTRFRAFVLWAIDNGYTANNPFRHFSIGEIVYGTPIYISNEERTQLLETDLSDDKEVETQRDIFVFQCLVGCRVSDLYKMTYRSIINEAVEYIPRKTKEDRPITVRVPLNDTAMKLIAKYQDYSRDTLFPFNTEQDYNRKIKEAFRRAGLDRTVTVLDQQTRQEVQRPLYEVASSHMARRTFIGNIYKKVKDPNLVGALSGHKEGSKAFARYRTIDDDMKKELIGFLD
ncbi:site-specific integrase [uncultured Alistipes sp.]|jgi:site-specific recombinase XerD|uniref:site-specific integrase n=1 Tax=uncultured Alistipes sp. TaxID=538949 RepID=UPI0025DCCE4C|nr:site-specific integrase [uncultured Alistipes sp.]